MEEQENIEEFEEIEETNNIKADDTSKNEELKEREVELPNKLEKIQNEKIRGRIIIFNPKESQIANHLGIKNIGDYTEKVK